MPRFQRSQGFTLIELLVVIAIISMLAAILFPVFGKAREKARQTSCANNQRQILVSLAMYAQDHEEKLPEATQFWGGLELPKGTLMCATAGKKRANAYGFNDVLSNVALGDVIDHSTALTIADAKSTTNLLTDPTADLAVRHFGSLIVGCLDGHVATEKVTAGKDAQNVLASRGYQFYPMKNQVSDTVPGPFDTTNVIATATTFAAVQDLPAEICPTGGAVPAIQVEFTVSNLGVTSPSDWGDQRTGNAGLGLFVAATPTDTVGLFGGNHCYHNGSAWASKGAVIGNAAPATPDNIAVTATASYEVIIQVVRGKATTTVKSGGKVVNVMSYTLTAADLAAWDGKTKYVAFHSGPGVNWVYARARVRDVKFFRMF